MNVVGRQVQRFPSTAHQQHPFSDNTSDTSSNNKWLSSAASHVQDNSRLYRTMQRSGELGQDPLTPPVYSRSSSQSKSVEEFISLGELSPGLLDLHSFDTELVPDSFDDAEPCVSTARQTTRSVMKSFALDKDRSGSVAKIRVVVRKRPLNKKEIAKKEEDIVTIDSSNSLTVHETKFKVDLTEYIEKHEFVFDAVLDKDIPNDDLYLGTVAPLVPSIFQKVKATCFAYGQTGSGKTYTMQPLPMKASKDILTLMHTTYRNQGFQLFVSFFEIYGGKLFDLLKERRKLCMREDGKQQVCIVGLQEYRVSNVDMVKEYIERGNATRSTGTTGANEESSRSHAILQLVIKRSADGSDTKPSRIVGKLSFIDLAGSERGADTTDNDKQTRMEGAEINKSLLALKECIRALDNDQGHIPFRGSKLTEVLRDSFVGDSRTVMISCISPNSSSCEHTLNTLRYADRVKSLSKGAISKKETSASSANLRDSVMLPSPTASILDNTIGSGEPNRSGWSRKTEVENLSLFGLDNVSYNGNERNLSSVNEHQSKEQFRAKVTATDERLSEESFEQSKLSGKRGKPLPPTSDSLKGLVNAHMKQKMLDRDLNISNSDDDLDALLKEEEDLMDAHRKQVDETIDIVREEMRLLIEADQPGSQLDEYLSRLSTILSQKAAGILNLQSRLAHFQRRLNELSVLVVPMGN